jgi:hypothetical protein
LFNLSDFVFYNKGKKLRNEPINVLVSWIVNMYNIS